MDKKLYLSIMASLTTLAAVWLFALLAAPIAKPLAWALIIGIATLPHHARLLNRFPGHPNRVAGLMVLAITVGLILPVAALAVMVIENAAVWYTEAERLIMAFSTTGAGTLSHLPFADKFITLGERFGLTLSDVGIKLANSASGYIFDLATNTATNIGQLLFTLAMALFILFFIYRNGEQILSATIKRFATDQVLVRRYFSEIRSTTTAVTFGTILTCLVQGVTAGLGYYVADVPAPILCGALTSLAALIPVVGTGIVWVPLVLLIAINGAFLKAALLALWCVIFVGLADNAIRPLAIGAKSNIPVPAIVLGAVCGVFALGVLGLIAGPVLFALLFTVWRDVTAEA
jgi:predicted PurR-regulated permease PerM